MKDGINARHVRLAIAHAYAACRSLLHEAHFCQESGDAIGVKARLERVAMHRDRIAERRLALSLGRRVNQADIGSRPRHYVAS